jgi:hypothetical protein
MAQQGQYTGETITGVIGEDVGLGQIVYSRTISTTNPDVQNRGIWFPASCDELNEIVISPGDMPKYVGSNQLGVVVQAASYSAITSTQSGTETIIMLKGYYSPGFMARPGETPGLTAGGYYYSSPGTNCGGPLYLMPKQVVNGTYSGSTKGSFASFLPNSEFIGVGATQGAIRILGYVYDMNYPYIVRFDPDNTWIEF